MLDYFLAVTYTPYFAGYSYVLARDNEYEADRVAGELTTPNAAASALIKTYVYSDIIDEHFWQPLYKKASSLAEPEGGVYSHLHSFLEDRNNINDRVIKRAVRTALAQETNTTDTHPSLMDRLKSLKSTGRIEDSCTSAANVWLDDEYERIINYFNQQWMEENKQSWQEYHERANQGKEALQRLSKKDPDQLTQDDLWNIATLTESYLQGSDPLPLYQNYYKHYPEDTDVLMAVGRIMLNNDNTQGVQYLKKAYKVPSYQQSAAEALWGYFERIKDKEQADIWLRNAEAGYDMLREAQQERSTIGESNTFIAATQSSETLEEKLAKELKQFPKVKAAWIAQKKVKYFQDKPVFVVALEMKAFTRKSEEMVYEIADNLDIEHIVFFINKKISKKITKEVILFGREFL